MPSDNLTQGLISRMVAAGQNGAGNDPAEYVPAGADADVAVQQFAEGGAKPNAFGEAAASAASRSAAAAWSDNSALSKQLLTYPATSFLAATFMVVSMSLGF